MSVQGTICFITLAVLSAVSAGAETVDEIIARHIEARGGREALAAVETARATGTLSVSGRDLPYTLEWKRPNKVRRSIRVEGHESVEAFDGAKGWAKAPHPGSNPRQLTAEDLVRIRLHGDFLEGELVNSKSKRYSIALLGKVNVDGSEAFEMKVTRADGSTTRVFIDTARFLIIRKEATVRMNGTKVDVTYKIGDYRRVGGILLPHSMEALIGRESVESRSENGAHGSRGRQLVVISSIKLNVAIDDERFAMPR